jgi:AraC-like DNA-binding protein
MGARCQAAAHGPIGFAAVTAPTIARSVDVMTRFSRVRAPHFRLTARLAGAEVRLVPEDRLEMEEAERIALLDIVMLSTQGLVEAALGRPMREARFELSYPAPRHAKRHTEHFHGSVRFGAKEAAVVIPQRWLRLECPLADPVMFAAALRSLAAAERRLDGGDFVAARVERLLASRGERLRSGAVARLLAMSRRTLSRRLRRGGTTYRALLDANLRAQAQSLLRDPALDVAEVGYTLGYQDAASFGRACRRWFGTSPGRYRRRLLGETVEGP